MSNDLPGGWVEIELPAIASLNMGQSPPSNTYNTQGKGLPFFQGKAEFGDIYPTPRKYCSTPSKTAGPEDILISVRAPVGPTNLCKQKSCIGRGLAAIRPLGEIPSRYLLYYFRSIEDWLSQQGTGSTFTAISKADLEQLTVRVAPLAQQRRIVAKLEELLGKVDKCQRRLAKIPVLLKRFRQSVLAAACSGRLTADWREGTPVVNEANECSGNGSESLPSSWRCQPFSTMIQNSFYGPRFSAEDYSSEGVPTIRTTDMSFDGTVLLKDAPRLSLSKKERERFGLQDGDLLVTRTGATIGKCALYDKCLGPAIAGAYLIRFRLKHDAIVPKFALHFFMSPVGRGLLVGGSTAVAQPNVNATTILQFLIPLPPLPEQQEIVRRVQALFALADQVEARYAKAQARVDQLTPSLLSKAFRGELVPQDPNDEPATVLLERIKSRQKSEGRKGRG